MLNHTLRPRVVVADHEYQQLIVLAVTGSGHPADANDALFYELDRARVVPEAALPPDAVRMGSTVTYLTDQGEQRTVVLVYPEDVDSDADRLSVLTPVGTALLGLRSGQSITCWLRDGGKRTLTALSVRTPAATAMPRRLRAGVA